MDPARQQQAQQAAAQFHQGGQLAQAQAQQQQQPSQQQQSQPGGGGSGTNGSGAGAQALPPAGYVQQFYAQQALNEDLTRFWQQMQRESDEHSELLPDFKNQALPLARIKKIMKSDEDVRMISAEAPVLFARACEFFIQELTVRSWTAAQEYKRRTMQRSDVASAVSRTDIFDFLVDIVPREDANEPANGSGSGEGSGPSQLAGPPPPGMQMGQQQQQQQPLGMYQQLPPPLPQQYMQAAPPPQQQQQYMQAPPAQQGGGQAPGGMPQPGPGNQNGGGGGGGGPQQQPGGMPSMLAFNPYMLPFPGTYPLGPQPSGSGQLPPMAPQYQQQQQPGGMPPGMQVPSAPQQQ